MSKAIAIDINQILKLLPHRYPFLLVDRVLHANMDSLAKMRKSFRLKH